MANDHQHPHDNNQTHATLCRSKTVLIGFLLIAGYFLFTEHRAHVIAFLPVLLFLACPLMHLFMHRGQGSLSHDNRSNNDKKGES